MGPFPNAHDRVSNITPKAGCQELDELHTTARLKSPLTATAAPIGDVMISAGELEMSSWQAGKFKRFPEEAQAVFDRAIAKFGGLWNVVVSQLEDEFPPSLPGYFAGRAPGLFKEKMKAMRNAARKAGNHPTASGGAI